MNRDDKYVMIVDDNDFVRDILEQYIQYFGYHPILCEHTTKAKEIFLQRKQKHQPLDLILMDIKMPESHPKPTGIDLGRELTRTYDFKNIIYITAYATEKATQKEVEELNSICIPKPFEMNQLKKEIDKYLS